MSNPFAQDPFGVFTDNPPPAYASLDAPPPPPSYEEATQQLAPPPSYDAAVGNANGSTAAAAAGGLAHNPFAATAAPAALKPHRPAPGVPSRAPPAAPSRAAPQRPAPAPPESPPPPAASVVNPFAGMTLAGAAGAASNPFAATPLWGGAPPTAAASSSPSQGSVSPSITGSDLDWLQQAAQPAAKPARAAPAPPSSNSSSSREAQRQPSSKALAAAGGGQQHPNGAAGAGGMPDSYWKTGSVGWSGAAAQDDGISQNLHLWLRLPPLNPKAAAPLKRLTAGCGHLFAGPAGNEGQLLHWSPRLEDASTLPAGAAPSRSEDWDSAPAAELQPSSGSWSDGSSSKMAATAMCVDAAAGRLWCGFEDGSVHTWAVEEAAAAGGHGSGAQSAVWLYGWKAHNGKVRSIVFTPAGHLFTGSKNGAIKMWGDVLLPRGPARLLRQLAKGPGGEAPHGKVVALRLAPGRGLLWSSGKESLCLWAAHSGEYIGTLRSGGRLQDPVHSQGHPAYDPYQVCPATGVDPVHLARCLGAPLMPLGSGEEGEEGEDPAAVALRAAGKVVGKAGKSAMKFIGKVGKKIQERRGEAEGGLPPANSGSSYSQVPLRDGSSASASACPAGSLAAGASFVGPVNSMDAGDKQRLYGNLKILVVSRDGGTWVAYKKGLLEKYDSTGRLLWHCTDFGLGISALEAHGDQVWVGGVDGRIRAFAATNQRLLKVWKAHCFPVLSLTADGPLVFSLAADGSIRGWPGATATGIPAAAAEAWQQQQASCLHEQRLQMLVGTWNVAEQKPDRGEVVLWLGDRARDAQLVVVGLQEVEMGTGSVVQAGVFAATNRSKLEEGTPAVRAWAAAVLEALGTASWRQVALRQMSGVVVVMYARSSLERHLGEVATASVACGVMGVGGNKGAVAVSCSLHRRRLVVLSSHFAAHQDKVEARNKDYAKIVAHLHFHTLPKGPAQQQQQQQQAAALSARSYADHSSSSSSLQLPARGSSEDTEGSVPSASVVSEQDWGAGVRDADALVWVGDFNYRVDAPPGFAPEPPTPERSHNDQLYDFVMGKISARQHLSLLAGDQAVREMVTHGRIFQGLAEGPITFLPTYKFEKGRDSCSAQPFYDMGEKKRVPAWCDRIMFRGSGRQVSALAATASKPSDVKVWLSSSSSYGSVLEASTSDHKPVYAVLSLVVPCYDQAALRKQACAALRQVTHAVSSSSSGRNQQQQQQQQGSSGFASRPQAASIW